MNVNAQSLAGAQVTFTGRLASMTRSDAAALVRKHGGTCDSTVNRRTTLLVVGQEGWPLRADGRLSRKLVVAKRLQDQGRPILVITEEEWLQCLGAIDCYDGIHRQFTIVQLGQLLKVSRQRLHAWIRAGLVKPVRTIQGVQYFDYEQLANVRTVWKLTQSGVGLGRIKKSLTRLARWLPNLDKRNSLLSLFEQGGQILISLDEGLADPSGQLQFDFGEDEPAVTQQSAKELTAAEWKDRGWALEAEGENEQAAHAYRQALYFGGADAEVCLNLSNVLYSMGQLAPAAERLWQAVELDHKFVEAWNNLGSVLCELDQNDEAIKAFRRAVELNPDYAAAHYNLADALQLTGQFMDARHHWKEFLRLEPLGEWAAYARRCLQVGG